MTITIYDVAKEAKVSMATVSRVVNNNPNVKEDTRLRVQEVIKKLRYTPNAVARGLASKKTTTIGIVLPDIADLSSAEIVSGIESVANMYKYNIILANSCDDKEIEKNIFASFVSKQVDGIIYLGHSLSDSSKNYLEDIQIPVVLAGNLGTDSDFYAVNIDYEKAAYDVTKEFLAKQTPGFSGADIANLCNEAALIAARNRHESVTKQDFLDAVDRIIGGLEKKTKILTPEEREAIAFHEAGHATVSWLLEHAAPLVKVTIVPRGQSLGAAWYLPEERQIVRTEQILDEMCAALGGRAAEKVSQSTPAEKTLVGQVDALIDTLYFTYGSFVLMGVDPERIFEIVHQANMGKIFPDGKAHFDPVTHKILKPDNWKEKYAPEPAIKKELERQIRAYARHKERKNKQ